MNPFGLKQEVIDFIVDTAKSEQINSVTLFGSRAKGDYQEKSDIDLAVEGPGFFDFKYAIEDNCPTLLKFDFVNLSDGVSDELIRSIKTEGIKIYG